MNATLLCPGPSLVGYRPVEFSGMVVAVNRAAELHACDVWAATDRTLIDNVHPLGAPALFTITATRESLDRRGRPWPYLVITHDGIAGGVVENGRHPWTRYTATAALQYLAWSGATHIDVWGASWAGKLDWDGHRSPSDCRTTQRWDEERRIWDGVIEANGITVTRH